MPGAAPFDKPIVCSRSMMFGQNDHGNNVAYKTMANATAYLTFATVATAATACSNLQLVFTSTAQSDTDYAALSSSFRITVSVFKVGGGAGSPTAVTFSGGQTFADIAKDTLIRSDVISGITLAKGDKLKIQVFVQHADGTSSITVPLAWVGQLTGEGTATGDKTGSVSQTYTAGRIYGPCAVVGDVSDPSYVTVGILGDSRSFGYPEYSTSNNEHPGHVLKALYGGDTGGAGIGSVPNFGYAYCCYPGQQAASYPAGHRMRTLFMQMLKGCNHVVEGFGINDMVSVASHSATTCKNDRKSFWDELAAAGVKVWAQTIYPATKSTDSWATATNQTYWGQAVDSGASEAQRVAHNDDLRANYASYGLTGVVEIADTVEVNSSNVLTRNGGYIIATGSANGRTTDGLHLNANGTTVAALGFNTATQFPADTTAPAFASASIPSAGTSVVVTLTETGSVPLLPATGITGFTVKVGGVTRSITSATRTANSQITLATSGTIYNTDTVTVAYDSGTGNVTDSWNIPNALATFTAQSVTNGSTQTSPDSTGPSFGSAQVTSAGTSVVVTLVESVSAPVLPATGITGFTVKVNGVSATISSATRTASTQVTLALSSIVYDTDTVTVQYAPGNVTDSFGTPNAMASFTAQAVTNNSTQSSGSTVTSVSVSPSTATVNAGSTQSFTATVSGTGSPSQSVTWSASAGSISSGGVFTPPSSTSSPQTVTITATSVQDGSKTGTATVTVPAYAVTSVTVTPSAPFLAGSATQTFTAVVFGTSSPPQTGTWSKQSGVGSINGSTGVYTAPAGITGQSQSAVIRFTPDADASKYVDVTVTISPLGAAAAVVTTPIGDQRLKVRLKPTLIGMPATGTSGMTDSQALSVADAIRTNRAGDSGVPTSAEGTPGATALPGDTLRTFVPPASDDIVPGSESLTDSQWDDLRDKIRTNRV